MQTPFPYAIETANKTNTRRKLNRSWKEEEKSPDSFILHCHWFQSCAFLDKHTEGSSFGKGSHWLSQALFAICLFKLGFPQLPGLALLPSTSLCNLILPQKSPLSPALPLIRVPYSLSNGSQHWFQNILWCNRRPQGKVLKPGWSNCIFMSCELMFLS